jgi:hypothetical protein
LLVHAVDNRLILMIFIFFFLINILSSGGHFDWWDGPEAFFVTESMVLKHTAKLDPSVPSIEKLRFNITYTVYANNALQTGEYLDHQTLGPVYTLRSLLLSAAAVPFYYAALILSVSPIATIGLLVNSLFISLTCVVIFCFSSEVYRSNKIAFVLCLIFGICSFVWPYNTTFWVQPLQALTLASSAYFIYKQFHCRSSFICHYTVLDNRNNNSKGIYFACIGGLLLGLSVLAHPTSLLFIPGFIAYSIFCMRGNIKKFLIFLAILGVTLIFIGFINYLRFGTFTEFGYGYYATLAAHNGWKGLIGLLISPGAGLIFYFPIAILLPLGAKYMYKENKSLFFLSAYIIIVTWIYIGTLSFGSEPVAWSGGIAWGPRYLIPVLPFITIILGSIFLHLKKRVFLRVFIIMLCIAGFYVNLTAILVWFQYVLVYNWETGQLSQTQDQNHLDVMTWNPSYSPILLHTKMLMSDYVSYVDPEKFLNTSWAWIAYGLAPCSYDIYLFCRYGIIPILAIATCITVVAVLIAMKISIPILSPKSYKFFSTKYFDNITRNRRLY